VNALKTLLLVTAVAVCPVAVKARQADASRGKRLVIAENGRVRVGIDTSRKGALAEFVWKASGRNLASTAAGDRSLYNIEAVDGQGNLRRIASDQAKKSTAASKNGVVTIVNRHDAPFPLTVTITCTVETGSPLARWRIRIENTSDLNIRKIMFPVVEVSDSADYVLLPACDGCVIEKPGQNLRAGYRKELLYPGSASAQIMAAGLGSEAGLYYAVYDAQGYKKSFTVKRTKTGVALLATHFPVDGPGNDYEQPYDVVLAPFRGRAWYAAADMYKTWAVKQHWCKKRIVERADIPGWLKKAPMSLTFSLRGLVGGHRGDVSAAFESVPESAQAYTNYFTRPAVVLLAGWQGKGYYISPHYFPPFGGRERFTAMTRALTEGGNRSVVFLCGGLYWTLARKPPLGNYDDWECFRREGESFAVVGPNGDTLVSGDPAKRVGRYAYLCAADRRTHKMMLDICARIQDLGVTVTQFESVGGGQPVCYSSDHGHPPGGGNYQAWGYHKLFEAALKQGLARDNDYALTIEEPGEFYLQVLSAYHARDNAEYRWPRGGPAQRGVPLFTYLYHEYALGYLGQGSPLVFNTKRRSRPAELLHAMNFVRGKMLALSNWSTSPWPAPQELEKHQLKMMRGIAAVLRSPGADYLMMGKMLPPVEIRVPRTRVRFWNWQTKKAKEISFPAILQGAYEYPPVPPGEAPDGKVGYGYAFVNIARKPVEFEVKLVPPLAGVTYSVGRYGEGAVQRLGVVAGKPRPIKLALAPGESTFVEVAP